MEGNWGGFKKGFGGKYGDKKRLAFFNRIY
jgi:hypothetical protein